MGSSRTGLDLEDSSRTKFCGLGLEDPWPWPWPRQCTASVLRSVGKTLNLWVWLISKGLNTTIQYFKFMHKRTRGGSIRRRMWQRPMIRWIIVRCVGFYRHYPWSNMTVDLALAPTSKTSGLGLGLGLDQVVLEHIPESKFVHHHHHHRHQLINGRVQMGALGHSAVCLSPVLRLHPRWCSCPSNLLWWCPSNCPLFP